MVSYECDKVYLMCSKQDIKCKIIGVVLSVQCVCITVRENEPKIHHYHRPTITAVTSHQLQGHDLHTNTSTMSKHNQQHIYFICRSEYIQFGHCSNNGALRGWDTSSKDVGECINILDLYLLCQPTHQVQSYTNKLATQYTANTTINVITLQETSQTSVFYNFSTDVLQFY